MHGQRLCSMHVVGMPLCIVTRQIPGTSHLTKSKCQQVRSLGLSSGRSFVFLQIKLIPIDILTVVHLQITTSFVNLERGEPRGGSEKQ